MLVLVTGEGPTDIGCATSTDLCPPGSWTLGPITLFIEKFIQAHIESTLTVGQFWFAPKTYITGICKRLMPMAISSGRENDCAEGKKRTRALMAAAIALSQQENDDVLPILFRDTDNRSHDIRRNTKIRDSIKTVSCFSQDSNIFHICPIVPCPTSEAWLLCALRESYQKQKCAKLETQLSGNDASPHYAKTILREIIGEYSARTLCDLINRGRIDPLRVSMPSVNNFLQDLHSVIFKREQIQIPPKARQQLCRAVS